MLEASAIEPTGPPPALRRRAHRAGRAGLGARARRV